LNGRNRVLITFIILLLFMYSNVNQVEGSDFKITQESVDVLSLDNATISTNLFSTYLEVGYTRFQFGLNVVAENVTLLLSLDNVSWVRVRTQEFEIDNGYCNGTGVFRIHNSLIQPFPFDLEQNEIIYIYIERELWREDVLALASSWVYHTASFALVATHAIIRPWIFTIDWTLPVIFGSIFLSLFAIVLVSRYNRKQIEKELRAKIKNEAR